MDRLRRIIGGGALALAILGTCVSPVQAKRTDKNKFRTYTVDIGTGLCVYMEFPAKDGGRPTRVIYDTGKGANEGIDNDLVSFLTSKKIGLKNAQGDFEGDIIDYFVLSHPHEDHFNGSKPLFESFDVRNIIESKQVHSIKYLKRFKGPGINEIAKAKAAGKDAHFYVVGFPYPNHFDQPRLGKPYDEYALCNKFLPEFMKGKVDCAASKGKVTYPFGPQQVAQTVQWDIGNFMGDVAKAMKSVNPELHGKTIEVDLLPLGTRFDIDADRNSGFTIVHGDSIAAFDHNNHDKATYREAFPYYREADLNDGSVSIQATFGNTSVFVPGDTEGREKKPSTRFALSEIFGTGEGNEKYTVDDVMKHLRWDKDPSEQLHILDYAAPYVMSSDDIREMTARSFVTYDQIAPEEFVIKPATGNQTLSAKSFSSPADIDPSMVFWESRNENQKKYIHPQWRERIHNLHMTLRDNRQKKAALKNRFAGWVKGKKPRIIFDEERQRFVPNWHEPVWTVTNIVQLAERIYYVEPFLAHIMAGFIMSSKPFLDYIAPEERVDWAKRGERHMLHVAAAIKQDTNGEVDVIKSDVLFFGHHGSFTSSSLGFVLSVAPNVGIISADDKSYSGSTLPDFSAIFWNLNTHHPRSRAIFHSAFFHADLLAERRGEKIDDFTRKGKYSHSVSKIFKTRRLKGGAIPIWRTDFNDDLTDRNVLVDNIVIETDGVKPIWQWARNPKKGNDAHGNPNRWKIPKEEEALKFIPKYQYFFQALGFKADDSHAIRPHDPSGEIACFQVQHRLPLELEHERDEDGHLIEDDEEDWTRSPDHDHHDH